MSRPGVKYKEWRSVAHVYPSLSWGRPPQRVWRLIIPRTDILVPSGTAHLKRFFVNVSHQSVLAACSRPVWETSRHVRLKRVCCHGNTTSRPPALWRAAHVGCFRIFYCLSHTHENDRPISLWVPTIFLIVLCVLSCEGKQRRQKCVWIGLLIALHQATRRTLIFCDTSCEAEHKPSLSTCDIMSRAVNPDVWRTGQLPNHLPGGLYQLGVCNRTPRWMLLMSHNIRFFKRFVFAKYS